METIQVNKLTSWFQTTHNKDIYQWISYKYKSINSLKQEIKKVQTKKNTPPNMNIPSKTWQELKKVKYKVKHLDTI